MNPPPRYGAATEAAIENFTVSGEPVPRRVVRALAEIKLAAASANASIADSGVSKEMAAAIAAAAREVIDGQWDDQFPVDVFQTGSGTSTNMNMNEVLASLASERLGSAVHPNDHVNASQSSNDTFPTAIRVAALDALTTDLIPALRRLERELGLKAVQFASVVKAGRTHLMDATPIMLGDEFGAYRAQVHDAVVRLESVIPRVAAVPLGGTATGNGLNAPDGYAAAAVHALAEQTGLPLTEAADHFAVQGSQDALVELSAQLRGAAVSLYKVANDVRFLASGPHTGLGEIRVPELQPGSSIMPAKTNPVICEVVMQVAAQIIGNDAAIAFAGTQGNLELNVFLPLMARNLLQSIDLASGAATAFADKCVVAIGADLERCRSHADATPAIAAALNHALGYDTAGQIVRTALETGRTIRAVAVDDGLLDEETAARLLDPVAAARGTVARNRPDLPFEDPDIPATLVDPDDSGTIGAAPP